jgi:hypothetical protein
MQFEVFVMNLLARKRKKIEKKLIMSVGHG